jgi:hypothetical protein
MSEFTNQVGTGHTRAEVTVQRLIASRLLRTGPSDSAAYWQQVGVAAVRTPTERR